MPEPPRYASPFALIEIILDHVKGRHDGRKEYDSSTRMAQIYFRVKVKKYFAVQEFAVQKARNGLGGLCIR